jgi:hypothetical protein
MISRASHRSCRSSWLQALMLVLAIATPAPTWADSELIAGRAAVIDGDTLEIHGERIRLFGIDAPESGQTCLDARGQCYRCGQKAALVLDARIGAGVVTCERKGTDRCGRTVALCRVYGEDLGAWMVGLGCGPGLSRLQHALRASRGPSLVAGPRVVGGPVRAAVGAAQGTPTGSIRRAVTRPPQRDAGFRRGQGEGERPAVNRYVSRHLTPPVASDPQRLGLIGSPRRHRSMQGRAGRCRPAPPQPQAPGRGDASSSSPSGRPGRE